MPDVLKKEPQVLRQRHGFTHRTFTLGEEGVNIKESTLLYRSEFKVPFDSLSNDRYESTLYSKVWLWLAAPALVLCVALAAAGFFLPFPLVAAGIVLSGSFAVLAGILFWHSLERVVGYEAEGGPLLFTAGSPTWNELDRFLNALSERKETYLRNNYPGDACCHSAADEIHRLVWLRDQGAITPVEYEKLKQDVVYGVGWPEEDAEPTH